MNTETKTFDGILDSLEPIREFITEKCNLIGMSKKKCYAICLAIDEVATNIINYGYNEFEPQDPGNKIDVIVKYDDQQLMVVLEDNATKFDPLLHTTPTELDLEKPMEDRPIGGLGIMLAIKNVDEFKYEYLDNKNRNIFIMEIVPL